MTRIMIITNNILAEQELQRQLQQMNYEVFVSASIIQNDELNSLDRSILRCFKAIIFSEYLLEEEMEKVMPHLSKTSTLVIRQTSQQNLEEIEEDYAYISSMASPMELRHLIENECQNLTLDNSVVGEQADKYNLLLEVPLTPLELSLLQFLYEENGRLLTKREICQKLWNEALTNSRNVQIYTLMGKLKRKLAEIDDCTVFIGSQRATGYYLTHEFFKTFQVDFPLIGVAGGSRWT